LGIGPHSSCFKLVLFVTVCVFGFARQIKLASSELLDACITDVGPDLWSLLPLSVSISAV